MYQIASINIMISFEPISHLIPSSCEDVSPVSVYQVNWTIHHINGSVLSIDTSSFFQVVKPVGHVRPCPHF